MAERDGASRIGDLLRSAGALLLLLAATGLFRLAAPRGANPAAAVFLLLPTPELILLYLAFLFAGPRRRGRVLLAASPILGLLLVWNLGELFYLAFYREDFRLLSDLAHLPGLLAMLSGIDALMRPPGSVLIIAGALALAVGIGRALSGLLRILAAVTEKRGPPGVPRLQVHAAALLLAAAQFLLLPDLVPSLIALRPLLADPGTELRTAEELQPHVSPPTAGTGAASMRERFNFPGISDGDVHLFIVESYGHTLFTHPRHRSAMEPVYRRLEAELVREGWHIRSGFVRSPAFGGRSWLADATILTGIQIETQEQYDALPASGGENLTHIFEDAGYFSVMAAPGTRQAGEEWRGYYRFDRYLFRYDFDYQGPFVSFGAMPDQYLLYRSGELIAGREEPVFALYILVSTHVPFEVIPEYLPDWERLGRGEIFSEGHLREFDNNWLSGSEYPEGFIAGVDYSLTSIAGYLERYVDDSALAVIIGDHQPRIPVSEREASWSVPLHFISRDPALLGRLPRERFSPGLRPAAGADGHSPMSEVPRLLMRLLSGGEEP